MENMEELLKKYARAQTTEEETVKVRRYLVEHFDKVLQVIDEMRQDAKQELHLSDDADDPVMQLKVLLTQKNNIQANICNYLDIYLDQDLSMESEIHRNVQKVLFDLLLGKHKEK